MREEKNYRAYNKLVVMKAYILGMILGEKLKIKSQKNKNSSVILTWHDHFS